MNKSKHLILKRIGVTAAEVSAISPQGRAILGVKSWLTTYGKAYDFLVKHDPDFFKKES